jgi:hypothetical protein|tara:strand:+ start:7278 stop:8123 length:846 start_codon:yes stop_codon:yes gene_type:complete
MRTIPSLSFMQAIATFSLMSCLGLAYVINPIEDSLFFKAISAMFEGIYQKEVLGELNNSIVAGMLVGLFTGTSYIFLSMDKKVSDYFLIFILASIILIFVSSFREYDSFPYYVTQQLFVWFWIGIPVTVGMAGIWQNSIGNQVISAFLILVMPIGLAGNTNDQIYPILGFVFSFLLYLELSYGHTRYSRLARVMYFSKEFETVLNWFLTTLVFTLALTTALTLVAFLFHDFLGDILPYSFSKSIEFNTIYGQALSILVFFMIWAILQTLFSRGYLARQVED